MWLSHGVAISSQTDLKNVVSYCYVDALIVGFGADSICGFGGGQPRRTFGVSDHTRGSDNNMKC